MAWCVRALKALSGPLVLLACLLAAPLAQADSTITSGGPLTSIGLGSDLHCSVNYAGDTYGEFFANTACGTFLSTGGTVYGADDLPAEGGVGATPYTQADIQAPSSGSGTAADPYTMSALVWAGATGLSLTQTDSYVTGADQYRSTVVISNSTGSEQTAVLYHAADCYLGDDDHGYGYYDNASGGIFCTKNANNTPAGRVEGFIPIDGGSRYLETGYGSNWAAVGTGQPLANTCDCSTFEDNGMSIGWTVTVPAHGSVTRSWTTDFSPVGNIRASSYVALGDSVAAGEGIAYDYWWNGSIWAHGTGFAWDTSWGRSDPNCHQTLAGYPHVLTGLLSANLLDLACTSAGTTNGILNAQSDKDGSPQLGQGATPNAAYDDAAPDVVTLTVGADDVDFQTKVKDCYRPFLHACGSPGDKATLNSQLDTLRANLYTTLNEIENRGVAAGKIPVVAVTEYYSPFPNSYPTNSGCVDINPNRRLGVTLTNDEMEYLEQGLGDLNDTIYDVASGFPNVVVVPAPASFAQHRWCDADPWVYGPSIDSPSPSHPLGSGNPTPFHPTPEGQHAIAENIASYLADERHVSVGNDVPLDFGDISVLFHSVQTAGTAFFTPLGVTSGAAGTAVLGSRRVMPSAALTASSAASVDPYSGLPPTSTFAPVQIYSAGTSAQYTNGATVTLPALGASNLYEVVGGTWQLIPTASDGTNLTATLQTLGTLALGNPAPAAHAAFSLSGDGGQAPASVAFNGSGSTVDSGSIASYHWDFGDGSTATGAQLSHVYPASGTYTAALTITTDAGASDLVSHTVTVIDRPPVAVVQFPAGALAGQPTAGFDASGSHAADGPVSEVDWDFGDGTDPVSGPTPVHTFAAPGSYTVTATVWDDEGASDTQTSTVTVTAAGSTQPSLPTTSTPIAPPGAATAPAATPALNLSSRVLLDRGGRLEVTLSCRAHLPACRGTLTITDGAGRKPKTLAKRIYSLAAGQTRTFALLLAPGVTSALRRRARTLGVQVTLQGGQGLVLKRKPLVLKPQPTRRRR